MRSPIVAALAFLLLAATPAAAQSQSKSSCVEFYEDVTFDIAGFVGWLADRATPDVITTRHVYCDGLHVEESGDNITVVSLHDETITQIDTRREEYRTITFEELRALWEEQRAEMQDGAADADRDTDAEADVSLDFWVDGPLEHAGEGRHYDIHVVADVEGTATDTETGETQTFESTLAFVTETWREPFERYDLVTSFQQAFAEAMTDAALGTQGRQQLMETLNRILQNDARMQAGLEEAQKQSQRLDAEGASARERTHLVTVSAGLEYDPGLVVAPQQEEEQPTKKKGRLARLREAAQQAAAGTTGESGPRQRTLATFDRVVRDYRFGTVEAIYAPPAGYEMKEWRQN